MAELYQANKSFIINFAFFPTEKEAWKSLDQWIYKKYSVPTTWRVYEVHCEDGSTYYVAEFFIGKKRDSESDYDVIDSKCRLDSSFCRYGVSIYGLRSWRRHIHLINYIEDNDEINIEISH